MKHINNTHEGTVHLWHVVSGKRFNLKPGVNVMSEDDHQLFEYQLSSTEGLIEVAELHDTPDRQEAPKEESECVSDVCEVVESPSKKKKARKVESLDE